MEHEKIITRANGNKLKIYVWTDNTSTGFKGRVTMCKNGENSFTDLPFDKDNIDLQSIDESSLKQLFNTNLHKYVSKEELYEAKLELWNKMKPKL